MANIADGDVMEGRVVCQLGDQIGINVYHWRAANSNVIGGQPVTTVEAVAFMDAGAHVVYPGVLTQAAIYFGMGLRRVLPTITLEDGTSVNQTAGTRLFDPLPASVCGLLAIITGLGGRRQRGRKYMPFPAQDCIDSAGKPAAGYKTSILSVGGWYSATLSITGGSGSTVDLIPVIKHGDNTTDDVTIVAARQNWGTQKSRGGYGRPNVLPVW